MGMGLERRRDSRYNSRMHRLRNILRIALLTLLAAASLNGLMVFLFFDGTNFYGHLSGLQAKAQAESDARTIRHLEARIAEARAEGNLSNVRMEKTLRKEYAHLDTALRNADIHFRAVFPKRDLEARFRSVHPFQIKRWTLSICIRSECFYEETVPRYAQVRLPDPASGPSGILSLTRLGDGSESYPVFAFVLARKTGPVELWLAYRRLDDSSYAYYSEYLLDSQSRRLMKRGADADMERAP
jgi:hypothetical protein